MDNQSPVLNVNLKSSYQYTQNVWFAEYKIYDQFGDCFQPLIKANRTAGSICGYTSITNALKVAECMNNGFSVEEIILLLSDTSTSYGLLDIVMKWIQNQRSQYVKRNTEKFLLEKDSKSYLTDWVANYEISDYLRVENPELIRNVWFFRNCAYDHPDLLNQTKHEEAERLIEELPFKGEKYFVERFQPQRELLTMQQFADAWVQIKERSKQIFIMDLLGHFNVLITQKVNKQLVFCLLDTTGNSYTGHNSIMKLLEIIQYQ